MLRKRIIFTLIYCDGYFMQSRNFRLQRVGDIHWLKKNYQFQKIAFSLDELVILNASRCKKDMISFAEIVSDLAKNIFIPVVAGGGIKTLRDAEVLFNNGADKIVLNSLLYQNPEMVRELVSKYGSQSILASIDYKRNNEIIEVYISDGSVKLDLALTSYLHYLENLQIGEVYLNSIDRDGTGFGYDLEIFSFVQDNIGLPLIMAGGAGNEKHLLDCLKMSCVNAAATANLFNFIGDGLSYARKTILNSGVNIAPWENVQF